MRVLFLHNRYRSAHPSGEDVVVDQEVALLREHGHEVRLHERRSDDIATMGVRDKLSLPGRVVWSPRDARAVADLVRSWPPDVAHIHNTFPLMSPSVVKACSDAGVAVVATLHNFRLACAAGTLLRDGQHCHDCVGGSARPALQHRCYRGSLAATAPLALSIELHRSRGTWPRHVDTFVTMSEFARNLMASSGVPRDLISIKPHFVPEPSAVRTGDGSYAMFLGRLSTEKGPDVLLDAWQPDMGPLMVVGDGPLRQPLEETARRRNLDVTFMGTLAHDHARRLLADARVLVMSSRFYETFGMSAVEAMSAGVPVVAPRLGVLPEVVTDEHTGLLYAPGDATDLRRVLRLALEPATAQRLGSQARAAYLEHYTGARNHELMVSLYQEAIRRRARRRT